MNVPIPGCLAHRPVYRGLAIPYMTFVGNDGIPDFKVNDEAKRISCLVHGLCAICGKRLDENMIVFIGGPLCVHHRLFMDPAMHRECALYCTRACPYLSRADGGHSDAAPRHAGDPAVKVEFREEVSIGRPSKMALYCCRGYQPVYNGGVLHALAGEAFDIDWDVMPSRPLEKS
jgi:hypothetical protein